MYGPPQNVTAVRNGDEVTISWSQVTMTQDDDRGYLLELFVCQDTFYKWWTDSYAGPVHHFLHGQRRGGMRPALLRQAVHG